MSIQTSNTTTKRGLVQLFEREIGLKYGDVSANSNRLLEFIADANNAIDNYLLLWATSAGTWQGDDINHNDFQIITMNLVSGQRDYTFTVDEDGNRIVDVSAVLILPSATATEYRKLPPVDELKTDLSEILLNTNSGTPEQYGKIGNGVLLDKIPNYNATNGLKMVVNREGSYLTTSDTTKIVGVPAHHEYFYLRPALDYARRNSLSNIREIEKAVLDLEGSERLRITGKIQEFFSRRERDVVHALTPERIVYE